MLVACGKERRAFMPAMQPGKRKEHGDSHAPQAPLQPWRACLESILPEKDAIDHKDVSCEDLQGVLAKQVEGLQKSKRCVNIRSNIRHPYHFCG